jgi:hypothetical protein
VPDTSRTASRMGFKETRGKEVFSEIRTGLREVASFLWWKGLSASTQVGVRRGIHVRI